MPFDYGLRLHNRQRIANARAKPIEANKNQAVDGAEGLFLRSGSPQNVYLLPQHPNFDLERCPRPKQIRDHPTNEPDKISHPATTSPDSRSTASQIKFAIGTARRFQDLQDSLDGIAPTTLSERLRTLEQNGVVGRRFYSMSPPRAEYVLTEKGRDLGPIVGAMRNWGRKYSR
jgi:HxlR-like helix-turn-helix